MIQDRSNPTGNGVGFAKMTIPFEWRQLRFTGLIGTLLIIQYIHRVVVETLLITDRCLVFPSGNGGIE